MENGNSLPLPSGFGTRPWLIQQTCGGSCKDAQTTLVDMPDRSLHAVTIPEMQGKICLGCVYDGSWLFMLDEATHDCFLLNVVSRRPKISLPPLCPTKEYRGATCGVVGSPANFTVVIASDREAEQMFLLCYRPGDEEWTDLTADDDGCGVRFSGSIASHAGKLYAGELVVMDVDDGEIRSQDLSTDTEDHDRAMFGSTVRYLVVSHGDLFDVLIKYRGRPYDGSLIMMAVRRLDLSDLVWRRVESIGSDRVFLLSGDYGFSCSAASAQLQGNCPWSMVTNPIEQAHVWPWLMHISKQDGKCKMLDPLRGEQYVLQVEAFKTEMDHHIFRSSKDGWVVASAGPFDDEIFIINPFTQDIVETSIHVEFYRFRGITFSSPPSSPDSVVFGITSSTNGKYVSVETWRPGEDLWSEFNFDFVNEEAHPPFPVAYTNPIYFRGEFYCLGRKGNLAVFNPSDNTWRVLDKPEPVYGELQVFEDDHDGAKFCYLVELGEDLVSVFMRNADEPPRVFKLDKMNMAWAQVEDIGGAALFVDYRASFAHLSIADQFLSLLFMWLTSGPHLSSPSSGLSLSLMQNDSARPRPSAYTMPPHSLSPKNPSHHQAAELSSRQNSSLPPPPSICSFFTSSFLSTLEYVEEQDCKEVELQEGFDEDKYSLAIPVYT
ncbi:hypothetical protein HU200_031427 [Digitaria exilis]|uniref:KIB1-4 beta-propeller domain-containing protein n=1 Tax=Digitaria exilis TaxID=1010633 RepID=A0A835ET60_9POAL|nr:hypothetical protein HU200_031427 [Digitaria exilis]